MANDLGPNEELIGLPGSRRRLMTPALVLDLDAFEGNLTSMARLCREAGLALRPHGKTHKCSTIAQRQIAAGAVGVCCATLREAAAMVAAGAPGVHISSPVVDPRKIDRLIELDRSARRLSVVSDNPANAQDLAAAARQAGQRLDIVVDFDIGLGRTGTATVEDAMALVARVRTSDNLRFAGVQAYSGRVQHIEAYRARAEAYGAQLDRLEQLLDALKRADIVPPVVTGGGTGTFGIDRERMTVTEHQAGSYIFMDVEYGRVQLLPDHMSPFATALTMMCTVVSANAAGFVTIDGGFKCFATDGPPPELSAGVPPGARYERFGDEHGKLVFGQSNDRLAIGAKVELITPHCDPTVNLHDYYHCVRGDTLVDIWPIDGRGSL
jgi:3-hydroxy-D-aspartate aldolase